MTSNIEVADEINRAKQIANLIVLAADNLTDFDEKSAVAQGAMEIVRHCEAAVEMLTPSKRGKQKEAGQ